jgi:hypothetical protein
VVGLAELRDVAPGGVAGVLAGDMRPEGPVAGGFRILAAILYIEQRVVVERRDSFGCSYCDVS